MDKLDAYLHRSSQHSHTFAQPTAKRSIEKAYTKSRDILSRHSEVEGRTPPFIDDKQIWVFTPLTVSGTHSPSWNKLALGIEMLGDYDKEAFDTGRGLKVQQNAVAAIATLSAVLGLDPATMRLHREDPLTTHACPGKNVRKLKVIQDVHDLLTSRHAGEHPIKPVP
jgi:hypothetical protein